jgi:hypothetical protein
MRVTPRMQTFAALSDSRRNSATLVIAIVQSLALKDKEV